MKQPKNQKTALMVVAGLVGCFVIFQVIAKRPKEAAFTSNIEKFQKTRVPEFVLPKLDLGTFVAGDFFSLGQAKGQVLLVHFWASWCAPCRAEFPQLVEMAAQFEKGRRLDVYAVTEDEDLNAAAMFLREIAALEESKVKGKRKHFKWPANLHILVDSKNKTAKLYGTEKLPETYIVDSDRKLVSKVIAEQNWMSPEFLRFLEAMTSRGQ